MEQSKLFRTIGRINSILFLIILVGLAIMFIVISFQATGRRGDRNVTVTAKGGEETEKVEMVLGNLVEMNGHEVHYVELSTRWRKASYSSGYSGGQIRNVLFFVGPEMETHWLFDNNDNLIFTISKLNRDIERGNSKITEALFFRVIKEDTDGDGNLTPEDNSTLALTRPDGTGYREIETEVISLIDSKVNDSGRELILLLQKADKVYLKKYSLKTFDIITEKQLTEISKVR
ncbi:MAG: hypothetical protein JSV21_05400 [Nitrospirota bacterium]|nr:MAG: hypothetical protein JSV21_05400 [Nitrospirota bacterium]